MNWDGKVKKNRHLVLGEGRIPSVSVKFDTARGGGNKNGPSSEEPFCLKNILLVRLDFNTLIYWHWCFSFKVKASMISCFATSFFPL